MTARGAAGSPTPPSRRGPDDAGTPLLTIGELLARLAPEFPDVSHSKVRFLEDRGLVSPQRTPSGYRKFAPGDVERLRAVLTLQRDHYLPLRVIREHLDALDAGHVPPPLPGAPEPVPVAPARPVQVAPAPVSDVAPVGAAREEQPPPAAASREEVLAAAGGSLALVESLEDHGLLPRESAGSYPGSAVALVAAARALGEHGIEARHLRSLRSAVGHEAALVEQVVSPLRRRAPADERQDGRAQAPGSELVAALLALHAAALGCALDGAAQA